MAVYKRELSNLSYTNKDFGQIYPELLDLAKKISYKWDPSLSDESDPGVVLLKLAALMADKCNYNIDKNVLELFPMSVTQLANARQLFDQCGYTMRYFQSATTPLTFKLVTEPELVQADIDKLIPEGMELTVNDIQADIRGDYLRHYTIPRFTMFSDIDNSIVYTVLGDVTVTSDGNPVTVDAMQGTIREYAVNGSTVITADMLDSNNRIYFTELNIPENGIFIENVAKREDEVDPHWKQCDNLVIQAVGTKCYKFGLTLDGTRCYVEFPSDIDTLIGSGITIHYLLTTGTDGNIRPKFISQFFAETDATRWIGSFKFYQDVEITSENILVYNNFAAQNGRNPESIDDAYKNYQKVKTTFNTLVSTRDYTNFLITNKDVSNCVVCDRSDDIQSSYSVLTDVDGEHQLIPHVRTTVVSHKGKQNGADVIYSVEEPEMTAFDLRVYGLKYVDGFDDYKNFSKSFELQDSVSYSSIEPSTSNVKCLSHDYKEFIADRIILLKNRYPIVAKIVSPYRLALSQQEEILTTVKLKLFRILNSQAIEFGQEIDYNLVYDTILNADPRISAVILEDIKYETYAVYFSSSTNQIEHMRIDSLSSPPQSEHSQYKEYLQNLWKQFRTNVYATSILAGKTPLFIPDGMFVYSLAHEHAQNGSSTYDVDSMSTSVSVPLQWSHTSKSLTTRVLKPNDVVTLTAPNLVMDKRYANYCQFITNIGCYKNEIQQDGSFKTVNIRPDFNNPERLVVIPKNMEYTLKPHEYIIFFWRTSDDETERFKYVKYTGRNADSENPVVICPSWNMVQQPHTANIDTYVFQINDDFFMKLGDSGDVHVEGKQLEITDDLTYTSISNDENKTLTLTLNRLVGKYFVGDRFNVKSNSVEVKKINKIHLNNKENGTTKFYWVLNHVTDSDTYRLFSADENDTEYTLQDGEMLIYSNEKLTQLYVLGAGTKIQREVGTRKNVPCTAWECPALPHKLEFLSSPSGPAYFEQQAHPWFNITKRAPGYDLYATEMIYRKLGAETQLVITPPEDGTLTSQDYCITKDGIRLRGSSIDPEFHTELCSFTIVNEFQEEEKLPERNTLALAWKVASSLNLNMSHTNPQRLYEGQTLSWQPTGESAWYSITGSDLDEIYMQSDRPVSYTGGTNIDVRYYNILNETYDPLSIYLYKLKDIDMSLSLDTNYYDAVWNFSDQEVSVTGDDVVLTNITLPAGDYVLPVVMDNIDPEGVAAGNAIVTPTWTELRKLKLSKLTEDEQLFIRNLQTTGSSSGVGNENNTDWHVGRKPVQLADVAKWIYGSAYVDVSNEFKMHTISSAFNALFMNKSSTTVDPQDSTKLEFELRPSISTEYDTDLSKMLIAYGGTSLKDIAVSQPSSYEVGDIISLRIDKVSDLLGDDYEYGIWTYAPTTVSGSTDVFIHVSSAGICKRATSSDLQEALNKATYHYTLRPSDIPTGSIDTKLNSVVLKTVTNNIVNKNATYYYMLTIKNTGSGGSSYTLRLKYNGTSTTHPTYRILNPVKYTRPTLTSTSETEIDFFDDIVAELAKMDTRSLFNYAYTVPEDQLVSYPLDSLAFLSEDHPLNRFTICQYIINESKRVSDLVVSGKSR